MTTVVLTPQASNPLNALPRAMHLRVLQVLDRLTRWPEVSGAKPLRGSLAGRFRIRTGDYRVQFFVEGRQLVVERIGHRDGFYQE